jgi:decaprenylphospho-beta-D-ribofuranose 2-oxidase
MNQQARLSGGARRVHGGFGRALMGAAVYRCPSSVEDLRVLLRVASEQGMSVALRGNGRSYGDASTTSQGMVLDLSALNRILSWDSTTGVIDVECGVTIEQIWRRVLPEGYWPAVVPGTMAPTVGGCVAMNIHGKNHFCMGPFGDHVQELDLLTPQGTLLTCRRDQHADVFHAVIGGFGVLGVTTRVRLTLKKVPSGFLTVKAVTVPNLEALFDTFEAMLPDSDYLVAWTDLFTKGKRLGRSVIHQARYVSADDDPLPGRSFTEGQALPERFFGVIPRGLMWRLFQPWVHDLGMRFVNTVKYRASQLLDGKGRDFLQSHVGFAFLLDYVPRWRDTYGLGGFIQVQPFVPADTARETMRRIIETCQAHGIVPYLGVFKRHRPDDFLLSHALDGWSMAMDIRVTRRNRERVWALGQAIGDLVVEAGGHFYFAKDGVARADQVAAAFGEERISAFRAMKERLDPAGLLSTGLSRRILPGLPCISPTQGPDLSEDSQRAIGE